MSEARRSARLSRREFAGLLAGAALPTLGASQATPPGAPPDYVPPPRPLVSDAPPFAWDRPNRSAAGSNRRTASAPAS